MSTSRRDWAGRALEALGRTPEEIADTLRRAGYRGHLYEADACPVARYLSARLHCYVAVDINAARWWDRRSRAWVCLPLPQGVRAFIFRFDHKAFPDLVLEEEGSA
jgi:hypothetical protein